MEVRVLFFSRGRGRGHAIPDIAITTALRALAPGMQVEFVSYATGADTFRAEGLPVHDMGFSEDPPYLQALFKASDLIRDRRPHVVLSHEEFPAVAAAELNGVPAIFISAWLPIRPGLQMDSLVSVSSVILMESPGIFPRPAGMSAKILCVGPLGRKLTVSRDDRPSLRREMDIAPDAFVVLLAPGSFPESRSPIAGVVREAMRLLPMDNKRLFWIAGADFDEIHSLTAREEHIVCLKYASPIEKYIAVADVVVTKGTRGVTLDSAAIGVPTISLSPEINAIDDLLTPRMRNNTALIARAVDGETLAHYLTLAADRGRLSPGAPDAPTGSPEGVALCLKREIQELSRLWLELGDDAGAREASLEELKPHA